jgi:hypothetical protein
VVIRWISVGTKALADRRDGQGVEGLGDDLRRQAGDGDENAARIVVGVWRSGGRQACDAWWRRYCESIARVEEMPDPQALCRQNASTL